MKALVTSAIKKAVENAPSEQSGQAQTIAITAAQAQALGFFNRLMFDGPEHVSPAVLAKMNPENFEEELRTCPPSCHPPHSPAPHTATGPLQPAVLSSHLAPCR